MKKLKCISLEERNNETKAWSLDFTLHKVYYGRKGDEYDYIITDNVGDEMFCPKRCFEEVK